MQCFYEWLYFLKSLVMAFKFRSTSCYGGARTQTESIMFFFVSSFPHFLSEPFEILSESHIFWPPTNSMAHSNHLAVAVIADKANGCVLAFSFIVLESIYKPFFVNPFELVCFFLMHIFASNCHKKLCVFSDIWHKVHTAVTITQEQWVLYVYINTQPFSIYRLKYNTLIIIIKAKDSFFEFCLFLWLNNINIQPSLGL